MKLEVINKVKISAEAQFDYEEVIALAKMPKVDIQYEIEEYIDIMNKSKRLLYNNYFHVKYYDERTNEMLIFLLYRDMKFGRMQIWRVEGICNSDDLIDELEDSGQIRSWLKTKILYLPKETDWVIKLRAEKIMSGMSVYTLTGLNREVKNAFLYGGDQEIAKALPILQRTGRKRHSRRYIERQDELYRKKCEFVRRKQL